ncbi:hypothetical protein MHYP_G00276240 [Metynnis hypsauchen]
MPGGSWSSCLSLNTAWAEHKGHDAVPAVIERTKKQNQLKEIQSKFQQRIQEKQKEQQELKQAVETLKRCAQSAVEDSERIFTKLIRSIEKKRSEVTELIRAQEEAELSGAEELLEKLEQEIADLQSRHTELEQLLLTEDHIHFLQSFQSLCVSSGSEDSPSITVHQHLSFDGVRRSLSELKERLEEFCREELSKIPPQGKRSCPAVEPKNGNFSLNQKNKAVAVQILSSELKTRDLLQCMDFCQLTLDPNTAFCRLILSEKNRALVLGFPWLKRHNPHMYWQKSPSFHGVSSMPDLFFTGSQCFEMQFPNLQTENPLNHLEYPQNTGTTRRSLARRRLNSYPSIGLTISP